jgi:predicted phosphodiesterase
MPTREAIISDIKRVASMYDGESPFVTRTFYRENGQFSDRQIQNIFGSFREARRASGEEDTRAQASFLLQLAKHNAHDGYREMNIDKMDYGDKYKKPKGTRFQTMVVASDIHDKNCDPFYRRVLLDHIKRVQPDTVILGGDIYDLPEFGKYNVDPREWDVVGRIEWVHEFLKEIREAAADTEIVFIEGNHEHRLLRHLSEATPALKTVLADLHGFTVPKLLGLDDYEVRYIARADLATFNKGDLAKELSKNYEVFHNCFIVDHFPSGAARGVPGVNGHHHRYNSSTYFSLKYGSYRWDQLGCGHERAATYCDAEQWNLGFMTVHVDTERELPVMNYHFIGDFAEIGGKFYHREENE